MVATKIHSGEITRNPKTILTKQANFYRNLYESDEMVHFSYGENNGVKLNESQKCELAAELTLDEIGRAIKEIPNNQTPGSDGLPADFYKVFFCKLKMIFLELYQHCFKVGNLHGSARLGVITLVPKKDRDLLLIKNWRPITLLCCEYRSGTVNSNTVNSKFHLIRSCCEYLARFLSFHV